MAIPPFQLLEVPAPAPVEGPAMGIIEQANREAQEKVHHLYFSIGMQMGGALRSLQAEKALLESGNRALENDICVLKLAHAEELSELVDSWSGKARLVAEKLKGVVERLGRYNDAATIKANHQWSWLGIGRFRCGAIAIETAPMKALVDSFLNTCQKINTQQYKNYPEYSEYQEGNIPRLDVAQQPEENHWENECKALVQSINALVLTNQDPLIKGMIMSQQPIIRELEKEVDLLEMKQKSLIEQKKIIVAFHAPFIKDVSLKLEKEIGLRDMMVKAHALFAKIEWYKSVSGPGGHSCIYWDGGANFDWDDATCYHDMEQKNYIDKMKSKQIKMTEFMSSIDKLI